MRPAQTLQVVRRAARRQGWSVVDLPGRGRGSHVLYAVVDENGEQLGRFAIPQHPRELSWLVLRSIESGLAGLFGAHWDGGAMTERPVYRVVVEREDQLWTALVEGLPSGAFGATDTDRFADLDGMVRDLVATLTETDPASFDLTWRYVQNGVDYTRAIEEATEAAGALQAAEAAHEVARTAAVEQMARAGLTQRAIGDALGLSYQRIGQLVRARPSSGPNPDQRTG